MHATNGLPMVVRGGWGYHHSEHSNHLCTMNDSITVAFLCNFMTIMHWCYTEAMATSSCYVSVTLQANNASLKVHMFSFLPPPLNQFWAESCATMNNLKLVEPHHASIFLSNYVHEKFWPWDEAHNMIVWYNSLVYIVVLYYLHTHTHTQVHSSSLYYYYIIMKYYFLIVSFHMYNNHSHNIPDNDDCLMTVSGSSSATTCIDTSLDQ